MSIVLWTIIILSFFLSILGVFIPVLPSVLFLWAGFLLYHFFINGTVLLSSFWWAMGLLTAFLLVADYVLGAYFVKRYGGSKWSIVASILGTLLFPFLIGPIGIIIGPFVAIFLVELILGKNTNHSFKVAVGSFFSFISSSFVKVLVQVAMIVWFFIAI